MDKLKEAISYIHENSDYAVVLVNKDDNKAIAVKGTPINIGEILGDLFEHSQDTYIACVSAVFGWGTSSEGDSYRDILQHAVVKFIKEEIEDEK